MNPSSHLAPTPDASPAGTTRVTGDCWITLAFDVGQEVQLERAQERFGGARPARFRHRMGTGAEELGRSFRAEIEGEPIALGEQTTSATVLAAVYAIGAISLSWRVPLDLSASDAALLAGRIHDDPEFERRGRALAERLMERLGDAVVRPRLAPFHEDYVVFRLVGARPRDVEIASLLRAEVAALSEQEVRSALEGPISYTGDEICHVDWLGAVLVGRDMEDEQRVLELANVTLLELRVLDAELTAAVADAYDALSGPRVGPSAYKPRRRELERVARLQADGAVLYEAVKNAQKLVGDDYLARLHARAAHRLRLADWDAAIGRKLAVLGSIYERLSDLSSQRRSEALEWIIILLIAFDIVVVLL